MAERSLTDELILRTEERANKRLDANVKTRNSLIVQTSIASSLGYAGAALPFLITISPFLIGALVFASANLLIYLYALARFWSQINMQVKYSQEVALSVEDFVTQSEGTVGAPLSESRYSRKPSTAVRTTAMLLFLSIELSPLAIVWVGVLLLGLPVLAQWLICTLSTSLVVLSLLAIRHERPADPKLAKKA